MEIEKIVSPRHTHTSFSKISSLEEDINNSKKIPPMGHLPVGYPIIDSLAHAKSIEEKNVYNTFKDAKPSLKEAQRHCSFWDWIWGLFGGSSSEAPKEMSAEEAREVKEFIASVNQLIEALQYQHEKKAEEENQEEETFDGDKAMNLLLEMQIAVREKEFEIAHQQLNKFIKETRRISKERMEKIEERFKVVQSQKIWRLFEDLTVTFGMGAAAIGLGFTNPALGTILFYFTIGVAADRLFDDFTKRKVADAMSGGDSEKAENYLQYIKLGVGLTCIAATLGAGGFGAISPIVSIASGATKLSKAIVDRKSNLNEADSIELSEKLKSQNSGREGTLKWVSEFTEAIRKHHQSMIDNMRNEQELKVYIATPV
jgi:hypothetical protein